MYRDVDIEITAGTADESLKEEIYRNLQVLYGTTAGEQALDRDFGISKILWTIPTHQHKLNTLRK